MESGSSLKDILFNRPQVTYLARLLLAVDEKFDAKGFVLEVVQKFPELELKARIVWMAEVLERYLPAEPSAAMKMIVAALPPQLDPALKDDDFGSFILAPLGEYVVRNGLTKKYLKRSLMTLHEITMRFSMEDAMRAFLNTFPEETLAAYGAWVTDKNYHVRRLVSESTRPLLPWSRRLSLDYRIPMQYLDILYADSTRYVTRSVANHLNDISKKDPELVVETLLRWKQEGKQDPKELAWLMRHALRTVVKQGHSGALTALGYQQDAGVAVINFSLLNVAGSVSRGDVVEFSVTITATKDTLILVDYSVGFIKANGHTKPKVFKWKQVQVGKGETVTLTKRHLFKADATTFVLYPGEHTVTLHINGKKLSSFVFFLK